MHDDASSDSAVPPWASADSLGFRVARRHDWIGAMQPITGGRLPVDAAPAAIYRRHEAFARGMVAPAARPAAGSERWPIVVPAHPVRRQVSPPVGMADLDLSAAAKTSPLVTPPLPEPVGVATAPRQVMAPKRLAAAVRARKSSVAPADDSPTDALAQRAVATVDLRPVTSAAATPLRGDAPEQTAAVAAPDASVERSAAQTRVADAAGMSAQPATVLDPASVPLFGAATASPVTAAAAGDRRAAAAKAADGQAASHLMRASERAAHGVAMETATPSMRMPLARSSMPVPGATSPSAPVARSIAAREPAGALPRSSAVLPSASAVARAEDLVHRATSGSTAGTAAGQDGTRDEGASPGASSRREGTDAVQDDGRMPEKSPSPGSAAVEPRPAALMPSPTAAAASVSRAVQAATVAPPVLTLAGLARAQAAAAMPRVPESFVTSAGSPHQPFDKLGANAREPVAPPSTIETGRQTDGERPSAGTAATRRDHSAAVDRGVTLTMARMPAGVARAVEATPPGSARSDARDIMRTTDERATQPAQDAVSATQAVAQGTTAGTAQAVRTTPAAAAASTSSSTTPDTSAVPAMSPSPQSAPAASPWPRPMAASTPPAPRRNHAYASAPATAAPADIGIRRRVASFPPASMGHRLVFAAGAQPLAAPDVGGGVPQPTSWTLVMARAAGGALSAGTASARHANAAAPQVEWLRPAAGDPVASGAPVLASMSPPPASDPTPEGTPGAPPIHAGTSLPTVRAAPRAGVVMPAQSIPVATSVLPPRGIAATPMPSVAATTVQPAAAFPLLRPMPNAAREPSLDRAAMPATSGEMHGVVPVAREAPLAHEPASRADTAQAPPAAAAPDIDQIVEHALRELMFRLDIERERRGYSRWS